MLLERSRACVVVLLYDEDDAIEDAKTIYKELNRRNLYGKIRMCVPFDGTDPAKYFELYGFRGIYRLLKTAYQIKESEIY